MYSEKEEQREKRKTSERGRGGREKDMDTCTRTHYPLIIPR
jgi:hypothetical protein